MKVYIKENAKDTNDFNFNLSMKGKVLTAELSDSGFNYKVYTEDKLDYCWFSKSSCIVVEEDKPKLKVYIKENAKDENWNPEGKMDYLLGGVFSAESIVAYSHSYLVDGKWAVYKSSCIIVEGKDA